MNVVAETVIIVAAVVTALGIIYRQAVRPAIRWARRAEQAWTYVEAELKFDSGGSTRDALGRIDEWTVRTDKRLDRLEAAYPIERA